MTCFQVCLYICVCIDTVYRFQLESASLCERRSPEMGESQTTSGTDHSHVEFSRPWWLVSSLHLWALKVISIVYTKQ